MSELSRTAEIRNTKGLHARAAAKFCKTAGQFDADIRVLRGENNVSGKSIMGLMMLGAAKGSEITIYVEGEQAELAIEKLVGLVVDGFGED